MTLQLSTALRNGRLDAIETIIGASPTIEIRTGAPPANPAAADTGTVLATLPLPADWLAAAAGGIKSILNGPWLDTNADASGLAGHFRLKAGATCHMQGTVGQGGGGDLQINNLAITAGQVVSIANFSIADGNA